MSVTYNVPHSHKPSARFNYEWKRKVNVSWKLRLLSTIRIAFHHNFSLTFRCSAITRRRYIWTTGGDSERPFTMKRPSWRRYTSAASCGTPLWPPSSGEVPTDKLTSPLLYAFIMSPLNLFDLPYLIWTTANHLIIWFNGFLYMRLGSHITVALQALYPDIVGFGIVFPPPLFLFSHMWYHCHFLVYLGLLYLFTYSFAIFLVLAGSTRARSALVQPCWPPSPRTPSSQCCGLLT